MQLFIVFCTLSIVKVLLDTNNKIKDAHESVNRIMLLVDNNTRTICTFVSKLVHSRPPIGPKRVDPLLLTKVSEPIVDSDLGSLDHTTVITSNYINV